MGGNALLFARTERKPKQEYDVIMARVMEMLSELFPVTRMAVVKNIHQKETFGDGDVLLEDRFLPDDWISRVQQAFNPDELMINRTKVGRVSGTPLRFIRPHIAPEEASLHDGKHYDVPLERIPCSAISFEYQVFQIDLVVTQPEDFQIAQVYYAYNDLGNLMGRIADRMGFKYGWDGLWKHLGEGNEIYATVLVTRDPQKIFEFLGYDYARWKMGFEHFENMFEFAASTQYFHRAPYQFENRNHKDRVRDEKRTTYQAFIAWIAHRSWLDRYTWTTYERNEVTPEREREKQAHLQRALDTFFGFRERVAEAREVRRLEIEAKKVWNGGIVGVLTGLSGEALGQFMRHCRERHAESSFQSFEAWVVGQTPQQVEDFVKDNLRVIA